MPMLPNPNSKTSRKLAARTEDRLTPLMKQRRDRFIAEYLIDFRGPDAMIRAGGAASSATKLAYEFLREPYVLKRIQECIDSLEEAELINRKRILAGLIREANYMGIGASHGARVSAYAKLATILGMDAPKKFDVKFAGGVMMVPMPNDPESWEKLAEEKQKELKEAVRT